MTTKMRYTVDQSCAALGITSKTFTHWCERLKIRPIRLKNGDQRLKWLTESQLKRLAAANHATLRTDVLYRHPGSRHWPSHSEVLNDLDELQAEVDRLARELAERPLAPAPIFPPQAAKPVLPERLVPAPRTRPDIGRWADYERITDDPELPDDHSLISITQLSRAHGVAASTAKKQQESHVFMVESQRYKIGRHTGVIVVNNENRWKALLTWWRRAQMREDLAGNCTLPDCPCVRLLTEYSGQHGVENVAHWRAKTLRP